MCCLVSGTGGTISICCRRRSSQGAKHELANITVENGSGLVTSGQRVDRSGDRYGHFIAAAKLHPGRDRFLGTKKMKRAEGRQMTFWGLEEEWLYPYSVMMRIGDHGVWKNYFWIYM